MISYPDVRGDIVGMHTRILLDQKLTGRPDLCRPARAHQRSNFVDRLLAAMVRYTDYAGERGDGALRTPVGARLGRLVFSPGIQAAIAAGNVEPVLQLYILPQTRNEIIAHFSRLTGLGSVEAEKALKRLMGFSIADVADWLLEVRGRKGGEAAYLLLLSLEFRLVLKHFPWLIDRERRFSRLEYGGLSAVMALAEFERAAAIVAELVRRALYFASAHFVRIQEKLTTVRMLHHYSTSSMTLLGLDRNDGAGALLRDHSLHVETRHAFQQQRVLHLSKHEALQHLKRGSIAWDEEKAQAHDPTRSWKRESYANSWLLTPSPYGNTVRRQGKNVSLFYGLSPQMCAAVAVLEITNTAETLSNARRNGERADKHVAHHKLTKALLRRASSHLVGSTQIQVRSDSSYGENLFRDAGKTVSQYLPPLGQPGSAARFLPELWLTPDQDQALWNDLQVKLKDGVIQQPQLDLFEMPPAARKHLDELAQLAADFGDLYQKSEPTLLTAVVFAHLATAVNPLSADPWLHKKLRERQDAPCAADSKTRNSVATAKEKSQEEPVS